MTLSDKLKLLRKEKKLTQEEASKKIGIALSSLRKYEQVGNPDVLQLKKIKEFYKVSYDYLLNDECTTREIENLEIVNSLGINENAVKSIRLMKNKNFLQEVFLNYSSEDVFAFLEEYSKIRFVRNYILARCFPKMYREEKFNEIKKDNTYEIEFLINYLKSEKIKQNYWDFLTSKEQYKEFFSSLIYINECWKKEEKIKNHKIENFNNNIFYEIDMLLLEYEEYIYKSFFDIINKFSISYEENIINKLK